MELVYCNCKKCDFTIGLFVNLWTKIGKGYFSPIVDPEDISVEAEGQTRAGEKGTLVQGCELQDIVCASCSNVVGLKCVETPVNHVLDGGQVLLRLASVELLSRDGQEAEFTIKRVLDVKEPSKVDDSGSEASPTGAFHATAYPEAVDILQLQADLEGQRQDINRIDSNGFRLLSSLDTRVVQIEESITKVKDTFTSTRRDISGIQEDLTSLKDEINAVKRSREQDVPLMALKGKLDSTVVSLNSVRQGVDTLQETMRKEIAGMRSELRQQKQEIESIKMDIKGRVSARDHAKDMASLRAEMMQMRRQMDEMRSRMAERTPAVFPSKELDILTSSIAKIGNKASQVETLQMELEILKGRVERTEASRQSPDDRQAQPRDISYPDVLAGRRKRTSGFDMSQDTESASKRPAIPSAFSDAPVPDYEPPVSKREVTPSTPAAQDADQPHQTADQAVRLTKSGKVDKRSQRTRKSGHGKKGRGNLNG